MYVILCEYSMFFVVDCQYMCVRACLVRYSVNNDVCARVLSSSCVCMQRKWMEKLFVQTNRLQV